eukprot:Rhum_TRINITY_DN13318_c1_g2::Rhum_TRINITY_DN13318_c1_g2_i1::g.59270::m.59270
MALQRHRALARVDVPHACRLVDRRRRNVLRPGGKAGAVHLVCVALQLRNLLAVSGVPYPRRPVVAGGDNVGVVVGEVAGQHKALVSLQRVLHSEAFGLRVPNFQRLVTRRAAEHVTRRVERAAEDRRLVAQERRHNLRLRQVGLLLVLHRLRVRARLRLRCLLVHSRSRGRRGHRHARHRLGGGCGGRGRCGGGGGSGRGLDGGGGGNGSGHGVDACVDVLLLGGDNHLALLAFGNRVEEELHRLCVVDLNAVTLLVLEGDDEAGAQQLRAVPLLVDLAEQVLVADGALHDDDLLRVAVLEAHLDLHRAGRSWGGRRRRLRQDRPWGSGDLVGVDARDGVLGADAGAQVPLLRLLRLVDDVVDEVLELLAHAQRLLLLLLPLLPPRAPLVLPFLLFVELGSLLLLFLFLLLFLLLLLLLFLLVRLVVVVLLLALLLLLLLLPRCLLLKLAVDVARGLVGAVREVLVPAGLQVLFPLVSTCNLVVHLEKILLAFLLMAAVREFLRADHEVQLHLTGHVWLPGEGCPSSALPLNEVQIL